MDIVEELINVKAEFDEFKETSRMIEEELENSIFHLTKQNESLMKENQKLKNDKDFLKSDYEKHIIFIEKRNEVLSKENLTLDHRNKILGNQIIDLENENEHNTLKIRETETIIYSLEEQMNKLLEQLALVEQELEQNKLHANSQIENLKTQLLETECNIKLANDLNRRAKTYITRSKGSITTRLNTENISFHEPVKVNDNFSFTNKDLPSKNVKSLKSISLHKCAFNEIGNKPPINKEKRKNNVTNVAIHNNAKEKNNNPLKDERFLKINENINSNIINSSAILKKKNSCNNLKLKGEVINSELMKKVAKSIALRRKTDVFSKLDKTLH